MNLRRSPLRPLIILLGFVLAWEARAGIVYSGVKNISIPTTFEGVYLDIDTGAISVSPFMGWDINPFFGGYVIGNSASFEPVRASSGNDSAVFNLGLGTLISGASTFSSGEAGSSTHMGGGANQFAAGSDGYIGFKWNKNDSSGPFYGWMRVELTVNQPGGVIEDWAFADDGGSLLAGEMTPEPGRLMLLGVGAVVAILRRRRDTGFLTRRVGSSKH
jgi:hypothetical protein